LRSLEVTQIIDTLIGSTRELIQGAGFVIESRLEPGLPPVMGDLAAISQCLQNLVGNAVKYSGNSKWIGVRAYAARSEEGASEVRIDVSDRGMGIDKSEIDSIFDPFYRSPQVSALQIHGTGLGLALAKRIAETLGGKLTVVSELAVGSTFTLHLPIAEGERLTIPGTPQASSSATP
jgi:signal transduction histidine kinase